MNQTSNIYTTQSHIAALSANANSVSIGLNNHWPGASIAPLISHSIPKHNYISGTNSIFLDIDRSMSYDVKKYEIYESPEDLLALSVTWRRLRKSRIPLGISSLLDTKVFEHLTTKDRETARDIRDYYSKKIMMWKLKGKDLTSFRKDLNTFVHDDGTKFKKEMIGLAYYLPEFYSYDKEVDSVREQVRTRDIVKEKDKLLMPLAKLMSPASKKLTPLKRINRVTKRLNHMQYWFQDSETNGAVVINIDTKNPLEHIWNDIFDNSPTLSIEGKYSFKDREDFEFFSITDWKLAKT